MQDKWLLGRTKFCAAPGNTSLSQNAGWMVIKNYKILRCTRTHMSITKCRMDCYKQNKILRCTKTHESYHEMQDGWLLGRTKFCAAPGITSIWRNAGWMATKRNKALHCTRTHEAIKKCRMDGSASLRNSSTNSSSSSSTYTGKSRGSKQEKKTRVYTAGMDWGHRTLMHVESTHTHTHTHSTGQSALQRQNTKGAHDEVYVSVRTTCVDEWDLLANGLNIDYTNAAQQSHFLTDGFLCNI